MNKEYSHCCIHNKEHKLMEDKVSGWMCLCACLHPSICEGKKASLAEEFIVLKSKRKTESRQNKDAAKSISKGERPRLIVWSVGASPCTKSIGLALHLEQHVHINTGGGKKERKNKIRYVLHSFQMGASHLMCEFGSDPLFKRRLIF